MNTSDIDIEKLRSDLIDYYGAAMFGGFPMDVVELSDVENASPQELIKIAKENKYDLNDYKM